MLTQAGGGALVGGLIGYSVKKAFKLALKIFTIILGIFAGTELVILAYLRSLDIISVTVNMDRLNELLQTVPTSLLSQTGFVSTLISQNTLALGGLTVGLAYGWHKG